MSQRKVVVLETLYTVWFQGDQDTNINYLFPPEYRINGKLIETDQSYDNLVGNLQYQYIPSGIVMVARVALGFTSNIETLGIVDGKELHPLACRALISHLITNWDGNARRHLRYGIKAVTRTAHDRSPIVICRETQPSTRICIRENTHRVDDGDLIAWVEPESFPYYNLQTRH